MYKTENNIDFYQLLKSNKDKIEEDDSICLISRQPLDNTKTTLQCGHSFNYINIYREVCNQKTNNSFRKFLRKNQIQCPYCRVVHDKVLPYLCLPCVKRIKYVNSPNSLEYLNGVCSHKLKNNTLCSKPCHENGLCNRHFNKNKKTELYENYLNGIEPITNYEKLPVDILKQLLKQKNIKGISKLNKTQLIKRLLEST